MRCYNGCPDSELKALLDARAAVKSRLLAAEPEASLTYFPSPGFYMVFVHHQPVGGWGAEFGDPIRACEAAIAELSRRGEVGGAPG